MKENKALKESKFTSSIARRINFSFFLRQLAVFLVMDILLAFLMCVWFVAWQDDKIPQDEKVTEYRLENRTGDSGAKFYEYSYVIYTDKKQEYVIEIYRYLDFAAFFLGIVLAYEGIVLFGYLFQVRKIRKRLRPLNEMAKKAEELSRVSLDSRSKFTSLENAITTAKTDGREIQIKTGDKDLLSLEIAINGLLQRMQKSYEQQNRFVSDASHELRTPIAVIQGYVNMLDRWGKEDESVLSESIEALKHESLHMKNLVEQLLFLARGDSGRNTLNIEEINLTDIVREVYEESKLIDKMHKYQFHGEENVWMKGDLAMVKQSVRIFTDNAAKYSQEGNAIILGVKRQEDKVVYYVEDEGIGMDESEVMCAFDRFYRSDQARNSKTGGTGLGLSIAKWIIEAHDGEIEVLTRPEFGTRFKAIFPI